MREGIVKIDPTVKCPHCGADMAVERVVTIYPPLYVALCPKRGLIEHPPYIYTPTIELM